MIRTELFAFARRPIRNTILLLLFVVLLARVPYAATNMDGARDMFTAWRLLHGESIPLSGPVLAGTIHLGPVWFFFLAMLLGLGGEHWLIVTMIAGALAALQVPLAYLAGKAVNGRTTGLLWASLLVLPSWGTLEALLPSHPQFIAPTMLAFIACAARYRARPRRRYLLGMALSFTLALHAHPAAVVLVWIGGFVLAGAAFRRQLRWGDLGLAFLVVIAPLLPFLYWDASRGFVELVAAGHFVGDSDLFANLARAWPIARSTLNDASMYWFATMLGWPATAARGAAFVILGMGALGLAGCIRLLLTQGMRRPAGLAIALFVAVVLTIAALRNATPYYMTIPVQVIAAGIVAAGLTALGDAWPARATRTACIAVAVIACVLVDAGIARIQTRGAWPFAWLPIMDVAQAPSDTMSLMLLPAYAMSASGKFLCSHPSLGIHGSYASLLLQNYAVEMRLACGRRDLHLGGSEPDRDHWLGLSRAMFARIDVEPEVRLGPVGLVRARPLGPGTPIAIQSEPVYPSYKADVGLVQVHAVRLPLAAGQHVAVSDLAFAFDSGYEVSVTLDGRPLPALATDALSRVYECAGCAAGSTASVELNLASGNLKDIDIAVF